ncbi:biotin/lipoyl-containing protein [Gaoshiqia sediminis]|uniref:Acetyl-CoA carboxylase biotin carboxyl carrier protein subunit n=1 Tax=Gaoshiqia sediminis TaxID=2986998 RepID=A0AA42C8J3_9BACT|nr:biotin/lipoyl-containing protein [Gaoshiqia sediminis]MCW0484789.1 acetyl-CoA carboxylase biotin carboxyl carrier protein subunit [Gaoshiqia sediminis]
MSEEKVETIIVHSAVYKTEYTTKYRNRVKWEKPDENELYSFIPGTIIDVFVKPGDKLKEGDPLLILEAMKMHNIVQMPFNGKIVSVHVKVGDKIPKKHLMIEIIPQ